MSFCFSKWDFSLCFSINFSESSDKTYFLFRTNKQIRKVQSFIHTCKYLIFDVGPLKINKFQWDYSKSNNNTIRKILILCSSEPPCIVTLINNAMCLELYYKTGWTQHLKMFLFISVVGDFLMEINFALVREYVMASYNLHMSKGICRPIHVQSISRSYIYRSCNLNDLVWCGIFAYANFFGMVSLTWAWHFFRFARGECRINFKITMYFNFNVFQPIALYFRLLQRHSPRLC